MRIFFITLTLVGLLLVVPSCKKTAPADLDVEVDTELVDSDDDDFDDLGLDDLDTDSLDTDSEIKTEPTSVTTTPVATAPIDNKKPSENDKAKEDKSKVVKATNDIKTVNPAQAGKLMKYNVVISTLSKEDGVKRLSKSLDKSGISYFVVRTGGLYMFVVASTDSEESAIKARKDFLLKTTVDKSRQQIWKDYEIEITDTYILENR